MKTIRRVVTAALALAAVTASAEQSCITSGSTNSVPDSVAWSVGTSLAGVVPVAAEPEEVEGRSFTWAISNAIDVLTDKLGFLLFLR